MQRVFPRRAVPLTAFTILLLFTSPSSGQDNKSLAVSEKLELGVHDTGRGLRAPTFSLATLDGGRIDSAALKGKAVVLNFWAPWCAPCREEMPRLIELQKKYQAQGLRIIGVLVSDADRQDASIFLKRLKLNYPVAIASENFIESFGGAISLPVTIYIGRDGRIVERVRGVSDNSVMEKKIKIALAAMPAKGSDRP